MEQEKPASSRCSRELGDRRVSCDETFSISFLLIVYSVVGRGDPVSSGHELKRQKSFGDLSGNSLSRYEGVDDSAKENNQVIVLSSDEDEVVSVKDEHHTDNYARGFFQRSAASKSALIAASDALTSIDAKSYPRGGAVVDEREGQSYIAEGSCSFVDYLSRMKGWRFEEDNTVIEEFILSREAEIGSWAELHDIQRSTFAVMRSVQRAYSNLKPKKMSSTLDCKISDKAQRDLWQRIDPGGIHAKVDGHINRIGPKQNAYVGITNNIEERMSTHRTMTTCLNMHILHQSTSLSAIMLSEVVCIQLVRDAVSSGRIRSCWNKTNSHGGEPGSISNVKAPMFTCYLLETASEPLNRVQVGAPFESMKLPEQRRTGRYFNISSSVTYLKQYACKSVESATKRELTCVPCQILFKSKQARADHQIVAHTMKTLFMECLQCGFRGSLEKVIMHFTEKHREKFDEYMNSASDDELESQND
jgi:hypothetical protein